MSAVEPRNASSKTAYVTPSAGGSAAGAGVSAAAGPAARSRWRWSSRAATRLAPCSTCTDSRSPACRAASASRAAVTPASAAPLSSLMRRIRPATSRSFVSTNGVIRCTYCTRRDWKESVAARWVPMRAVVRSACRRRPSAAAVRCVRCSIRARLRRCCRSKAGPTTGSSSRCSQWRQGGASGPGARHGAAAGASSPASAPASGAAGSGCAWNGRGSARSSLVSASLYSRSASSRCRASRARSAGETVRSNMVLSVTGIRRPGRGSRPPRRRRRRWRAHAPVRRPAGGPAGRAGSAPASRRRCG